MDGACDSSFTKKTHFKFVWGRCLRFLVFEQDLLQVCLGTVLAIVWVREVRRPNLFGDGACDSLFLKKIHSKFFLNLLGDGACDS